MSPWPADGCCLSLVSSSLSQSGVRNFIQVIDIPWILHLIVVVVHKGGKGLLLFLFKFVDAHIARDTVMQTYSKFPNPVF